MSKSPVISVSHLGICTADLEQSARFYTEALGFTLDRSIDGIGAPFDQLTELPGSTCNVRYVKSGALTLELIGYPALAVTGSDQRRPMNQLGFTHLTLIVDDLAAVVARVQQFGGRHHPETHVDSPYGPVVFCTDPNGVRIELLQPAG